LTLILVPAAAHSSGGCNRVRFVPRIADGVLLLIESLAGSHDATPKTGASSFCRVSAFGLVEKYTMKRPTKRLH
jgi:hypothetical protein